MSDSLLAAALSAITKNTVITYDEYSKIEQIIAVNWIKKLFINLI